MYDGLMAYRGLEPMERFHRYVEFTESCWLWTAGTQHGYGIFSVTPEPGVYKNVKAHRWLYEQVVGPVEQTLDHLCRVRHCVNPDHLEECSIGENNERSTGFREKKTHCPRGHSYKEHGRLQGKYPACRICNTEKARERRKRMKEEKQP